jgi:phosphoribosylformimino-5-aminoimidazole carboxamide ribotide isomerase
MIIIPAIDIIGGKCVRLAQGDYTQKKVYSDYPLEIAKAFEDAGLRRIHLVDLDGAKSGMVKNWKVLELIASKTGLMIDFGGGIQSKEDVDMIFDAGAQWATIGSLAVKNEPLLSDWLIQYGPDKFLLGADVRDEKIAVSGWSEITEIPIIEFVGKYVEKGVQQIFCTDISRDGMMLGPSLPLYQKIIAAFSGLQLIGSGGVGTLKDLSDLQKIGCSGVIIGKAIYEGKISLKELSLYTT